MTYQEEVDASHKYWKGIARQMLNDPNTSCSEIEAAIIGVRGSGDTALVEQLEQKKEKSWKANLNVLKKVS